MSRRSLMAGVVMMLSVPLLMIVSTPNALACSCAAAAFPTQVERADVVFSGRAIKRKEAAGSGDLVTWTFAVDRLHKGAARNEQQVASARSESTCGVVFEVWRADLVLASEQPSNGAGRMATDLCDGTRRLSEVPADNMETVGVGERPRAVAEPVAEADPWGPLLVGGLGAVMVGGFLASWRCAVGGIGHLRDHPRRCGWRPHPGRTVR